MITPLNDQAGAVHREEEARDLTYQGNQEREV